MFFFLFIMYEFIEYFGKRDELASDLLEFALGFAAAALLWILLRLSAIPMTESFINP